MFIYLFIRGGDNESLSKHVDTSEHKHQVLEDTGFIIVIEGLRNSYRGKLANRG